MKKMKFIAVAVTPLEIFVVYLLTQTHFNHYTTLITVMKVYLCCSAALAILVMFFIGLTVLFTSQEGMVTTKGWQRMRDLPDDLLPLWYNIPTELVLLIMCGLADWTITSLFILFAFFCHLATRGMFNGISSQIKDYEKRHPELSELIKDYEKRHPELIDLSSALAENENYN